jgi:hypothetical protein
MAKQIGCKITGRMDDYSFYHDRVHGYLVRRTGGVSSKEYQTDERYAAARNASAEFAAVSRAGKLIRDAFAPFIQQVKDATMVNRMNKELVALKQADTKHCRGERRAETMLRDSDANKWLRIFQFNEGVKVYELFEGFPTVNASGTSLSLAPARLLGSAFPKDATHAGLTLVRSVIDFEKGRFETSSSRMGLVSKAEVSHRQEKQNAFSHRCADEDGAYQSPVFFQKELSLHIEVPENLSPVPGTEIVCLQVVFFEEKDGDFVQLKGKVNGMGIVGIASRQLSGCELRMGKFPRRSKTRSLQKARKFHRRLSVKDISGQITQMKLTATILRGQKHEPEPRAS